MVSAETVITDERLVLAFVSVWRAAVAVAVAAAVGAALRTDVVVVVTLFLRLARSDGVDVIELVLEGGREGVDV